MNNESAAQATSAAPKQFSYGGQAVIEGVLMRGAHMAAVAVRDPNGKIVLHEQKLNETLYRGRISRTPFARGLVLLWDALGLGTRALMWSADVALGEDEDISFNGPVGWVTVAFSLLLSIGLFFLLPAAASSGLEQLLGLDEQSFVVNLLEGVVRLLLVIGYIWLIGFIPDVKRLFGYHGAEHKTINAYEAGAELTPKVVANYPIEHPRCGTGFLLDVVIISVLVFSVLGRPPFLLLLLSRILLVPVIAGIAYEFIRYTSKHMDSPLVKAVVLPSLALQHLTTNPPDESMLEVGIAAFKRVLLSENLISEEEAAIPEPAEPALVPAGD